MSWTSSLAGDVTNFTANIIVAVAIHVSFLMHALMGVPYVPPQQTHSLVASSSSTHISTTATKSVHANPPSIISSSTAQVGEFTIVVNCEDNNPSNVNVLKNGSITQTLGIYASDGIGKCPSAESQDINFDGYPDFMVLSDAGSGGSSLTYWLYSSSTQQFYCSNPYNDCSLMNPRFYPSTETIISSASMGAGTVDVQVYRAVNGKLNLLKDVQGSPASIAPLEAQASSTGF